MSAITPDHGTAPNGMRGRVVPFPGPGRSRRPESTAARRPPAAVPNPLAHAAQDTEPEALLACLESLALDKLKAREATHWFEHVMGCLGRATPETRARLLAMLQRLARRDLALLLRYDAMMR